MVCVGGGRRYCDLYAVIGISTWEKFIDIEQVKEYCITML